MKLSVIIPAHNEEEIIEETITEVYTKLHEASVLHEILVVNDHSSDNTTKIITELQKNSPLIPLYLHTSFPPHTGFGFAIRKGVEMMTGDCAALFMADLSDSPDDLVRFFRVMEQGRYDCVFGSRFVKGGSVKNYPLMKLFLNRLANHSVRFLFGFRYNDCTNAFKLYTRPTLEGLQPLLSGHFNITLELPLKAIVRGYSYTVLPNTWNGRRTGASSFRIKEMGSRYFYVLRKCFSEKYLGSGQKKRKGGGPP